MKKDAFSLYETELVFQQFDDIKFVFYFCGHAAKQYSFEVPNVYVGYMHDPN